MFSIRHWQIQSHWHSKFKSQICISNASLSKEPVSHYTPSKDFETKILNVTAGLRARATALPVLGKAVTRLSDNLFNNTSALQQRAPRSLTLIKRSCFLRLWKRKKKKKKSLTSKQNKQIKPHVRVLPFKPDSPWCVLAQRAWGSMKNSSFCRALTLQGSCFCFLRQRSATQYNSFLTS